MKLLAASATFLASAFSAQTIDYRMISVGDRMISVGEFMEQVYIQDGNTHKINLTPYLNAEYTIEDNSFSGAGTYGNGNGVITFSESVEWSETSIKAEYGESGKIKSHPWNFFNFYPEDIQNDNFDFNFNFALDLNDQSLVISDAGTVNGNAVSNSINLALESVSVASKKVGAEVSFSRNTQYPNSLNNFYKSWLPAAGTNDLKFVLGAKKACQGNPFDKACTAKVEITGDADGNDVGEYIAKYSVQTKKAQFEIKHNGNQVFWMGLFGIDTFDVLSLKYKVNGGRAVLAVQIVGPNGVGPLVAAAETFVAPHAVFFGNIQSDDVVVYIAVYFDKVAATWDNKMFNVYPIIEATKFESDLLKTYVLNGQKFQKWAEDLAGKAADKIVEFGQKGGAIVADVRSYVNDLTGPVGEAKFDAWFASL